MPNTIILITALVIIIIGLIIMYKKAKKSPTSSISRGLSSDFDLYINKDNDKN